MYHITLEQEEVAILTELDDEKTIALVGGSGEQPTSPDLPELPSLPELPKIPPIPKPQDYFPSKGHGGSLIKLDLLRGLIRIKIL